MRFNRFKIIYICAIIGMILGAFGIAYAGFNEQINFQGKLTNSSNLAVPDGTYNFEFSLYATDTAGSALWTETCTTTEMITVSSGLFSHLLGSVDTLDDSIFSQTLWLEVKVGSTTTIPSWETLTPRKKLGAVTAAFEAKRLGGKLESAFGTLAENEIVTGQWGFNNIFSIASSSASTTLTVTQSGAGSIMDIKNATGSVFTINNSGNITVGTWQGTAIGAQYGGTGTSTASWTGVPYITAGTWGTTTVTNNYGPTIIVAASNSTDTSRAHYVCDGTNDQDEIMQALNSIQGTGGTVQLLEGTYNIASSTSYAGINITTSSVSLIGSGKNTILKRVWDTASNDGVITVGDGSTMLTGITVFNLSIDGQKTTYQGTENLGIYFNKVDQSRIQNTWVYNCDGKGGILVNCQDSPGQNIIQGNDVRNNDENGIYYYGLNSTSSGSCIISDNTIQGNGVTGITLGYLWNGAMVSGNVISNHTGGAAITGWSNNVVITGNWISESYSGITFSGSNWLISSNRIYKSGSPTGESYGVKINAPGEFTGERNYIIGNQIYGTGWDGEISDLGVGTVIQQHSDDGYLGIGTTTPAAILDVYASSSVTALSVRQNGAGNIVNFSNTIGSVFAINNSGNITVGTWQGTPIGATWGGTGTSTASWTGYTYINNGVWATSSTGILSGGQGNYVPVWTSATALGTSTIYTSGNQVGIGTSSLGSYTFTVNGSSTFGTGAEVMRISSDGFVGIGTTTPAYSLDIYGTLRVATSSILGTITNSTWNGTKISNAYGGTGASSTNWTGYPYVTSGTWSTTTGVTSLNTLSNGSSGLTMWGTSPVTVTASGTVGLVFAVPNVATTGTAVTSLNTLTGAQTLWGTTNLLTINASGTAGQIFNVGTNVATTGSPTLSSLTWIGTIATGTWNGTAIGSQYGGTGTSTASWTGVPYITAGTWGTTTVVNNYGPTIIVAAFNSTNTSRAQYVCDGTNDETEINQALNALPSVGGVVQLLEGTYNLGTSTYFDCSIKMATSTSLVGLGASTVLKIKNSFDVDLKMICNSDASNGNSRIFISNLKLDGNKANNASGTQSGIWFVTVGSGTSTAALPGAKIENTWIENFRSYGMLFDSSSNNNLSGNTVQGNDNMGIVLNSVQNSILVGNILQGNKNYGIYSWTSFYNTIADNIVEGTTIGDGVLLNYSGSNTLSGNNFRENSNNGINLSNSSNNNISGNNLQDNGWEGIHLSFSNNNIIASNKVDNSVVGGFGYGIDIDETSSANTISSNDITSNNGGGYPAIIIRATCSNNYLSDNRYSGTGAVSISDLGVNTTFSSQLYGLTDTNNTTTASNLIFKPSGNVGIGTVNPDYKLHVMTTAANDVGVYAYVASAGVASTTHTGIYGYVNDQYTNSVLYGLRSYTLVDNAASQYGLHVYNDFASTKAQNSYGIYQDSKAGSGTINYFKDSVGIGTTTPATTLGVYGTSTFMSGSVGIGTISPSYVLDVSGTGRFTTSGASTTLTVTQSGTGNIVDLADGSGSIFALLSADQLKYRSGLAQTWGSFNDKILDNFEDNDVTNWTSSNSSTTISATTTYVRVNDYGFSIVANVGSSTNTLATTSISSESWSSYEKLSFWIRANYVTTSTDATTTQIISVMFHDTGGITSSSTVTVSEMGEWQYQEWDISGITGTSRDVVDWMGFRIDNDYGSPTFYIDQIRLYDADLQTSEMFVDNKGNLVVWGQESVEIGRTAADGSLPSIKVDSAVVELNQPLSVTTGGDVGFDYDLVFNNTGLSTISSEGPFSILAGDVNHYENLTLGTGGTGDVIIDINDSTLGFKVLGSSTYPYVFTVAPSGTITIAGNMLPASSTYYTLGDPTYKWGNIYTATATIGNTITINSNTISGSETTTISTVSGPILMNPATYFNIGDSFYVSGNIVASNFYRATVDSDGTKGANSSIAVPLEDTIYISYYDGTGADLEFAKSTNGGTTWSTTTISANGDKGDTSSISAPSTSTIYISYHAAASDDIEFAKSTDGGTTWSTTTVYGTGDLGNYSSIAAPSTSTIYVSYYDYTNGWYKIATSTDAGATWATKNIISGGTSKSQTLYSSIAAPSTSTMYVSSYRSSPAGEVGLQFTKSTDGGNTLASTTIEAGSRGSNSSITAPSTSTIYISYFDDVTSYLNFAKSTNGGTTWSTTTLDSKGAMGANSSIAAPSTSTIYISYFDDTSDDLELAKSIDGGTTWSTTTLDSSGANGANSSIAASSSGKVYVSYFNTTNSDLKFMKLTTGRTVSIGSATETKYQLGITGYGVASEGWITGNPDIAENYPTNDLSVESGDVIVTDSGDPGFIKKSEKPYQESTIGVISTAPGFVMTGNSDFLSTGETSKYNERLVALAGRVPVKVSSVNGEIKIGDQLTSSDIPGIAMKATDPGMVIGTALDNYIASGTSKIIVFINPHWSLGSLIETYITTTTDGTTTQSTTTERTITSLEKFTSLVKSALEKLGIFFKDGVAQISQIIAEKITAKKVSLERMEITDQITGDLYCTWLESGEWVKVKGDCDTATTTANVVSEDPPAEDEVIPNNPVDQPATTTEDTSTTTEDIVVIDDDTASSTASSTDNASTTESACQPAEEICDGQDNDCDGVIDEDCDCGETFCNASLNLTGSCQNSCSGELGCVTCVPQCGCIAGFFDCNGDGSGSDQDGCEATESCIVPTDLPVE